MDVPYCTKTAAEPTAMQLRKLQRRKGGEFPYPLKVRPEAYLDPLLLHACVCVSVQGDC